MVKFDGLLNLGIIIIFRLPAHLKILNWKGIIYKQLTYVQQLFSNTGNDISNEYSGFEVKHGHCHI